MRLAAALFALLAGAHGAEVLGYLENWNDVIWWDNGIPNNCVQGCFDVQAMINKTTPYSAVNYGFVFFTQQPTPNQNGCAEIVNKTTGKVLKTPAQACPVWDGKALYMSSAEKDGNHLSFTRRLPVCRMHGPLVPASCVLYVPQRRRAA